MELRGLQSCPECGEAFTRPGASGRCPGCGFEFDEHTRIWRHERSWPRRVVNYGLLGLAVGAVAVVGYRLELGEVPNAVLPIVLAMIIATLGTLMDRLLVGRLSNRFVAITPRGLLIGTRRNATLLPWGAVARLRTQPGRVPRVELGGDEPAVALEDVFDSAAEFEAFRQAFNAARRRYGGSS